MPQYDSPALQDPFADPDEDVDMSDIQDGLAVADDALDLLERSIDILDGEDAAEQVPFKMPPKETPPAVIPSDEVYGIAGALALVKSADGWSVDVLGRRISPLLFLGALGALWAAYKLMQPAPRRRRRR